MTYDKLLITHFGTTGLLTNSHEIIEIAAICCDAQSLGILWEFQTKVKPRYIETAQPHVLAESGYNEADWADAPSLREGFGEYYFKLNHSMIFTAWNVLISYGFYLATITYQRLSDRLDPTPHGGGYHRLDIASMAYPFLSSPVYRMNKLAKAFGMESKPSQHRAIIGARTEYQLLKEIRHRGAEWRHTYQNHKESSGSLLLHHAQVKQANANRCP